MTEIDLKTELNIYKKALELAIDDGATKIFDTYCIDKTHYYGNIPSMKYEEDYIKEAKEEIGYEAKSGNK